MAVTLSNWQRTQLEAKEKAIEELKSDLQNETNWAKHYSDRTDELRLALEKSTVLLRAMKYAQPVDLDSLNRVCAENQRVLEKQP